MHESWNARQALRTWATSFPALPFWRQRAAMYAGLKFTLYFVSANSLFLPLLLQTWAYWSAPRPDAPFSQYLGACMIHGWQPKLPASILPRYPPLWLYHFLMIKQRIEAQLHLHRGWRPWVLHLPRGHEHRAAGPTAFLNDWQAYTAALRPVPTGFI